MQQIRTLVLNSQYMPLSLFPLSVIPGEEALQRWSKNNLTIVESYPRKVLTQSRDDLYWPSVIANHNSHTYSKEMRVSPEGLFYRDHCRCQYCGIPLTISTMTYDHFIPVTKGGRNTWTNLVTACKDCNNRKGSSTSPKWKPMNPPWEPTFYDMIKIRSKYPQVVDDESWIKFLPRWEGEIIVRGKSGYKEEPSIEEIIDEFNHDR